MDVAMFSFKKKLLKALGNYKYSPFHPPKMLKSSWIISDPA